MMNSLCYNIVNTWPVTNDKPKTTTVLCEYMERLVEESTAYNKALHYLGLKNKEELLNFCKQYSTQGK